MSAESGIVNKGKTITFTESANMVGTFTHTSSSTSIVTVSPSNYDNVAADVVNTVTVTKNANATGIITVTFTPIDTINYNIVTKTYTAIYDYIRPVWTLESVSTSNGTTTGLAGDSYQIKIRGTDDSGLMCI